MADMAQNSPSDKGKRKEASSLSIEPASWQRRFKPTHLASLLPKLIKPAFKNHSAALASLMTEWPHIIGPAYGRRSEPKKISAGTLTISCDSVTAVELSYISANILERINTFMGRKMVERLRFVHASTSLSPQKTQSVAVKPVSIPIADLPEGDLKTALSTLGGAIKQRDKKRKNTFPSSN